ncbi:MAG: hypothetical protein FWC27_10165 [Firmicutes bacterium]|nr:hypothetical protein [Bacillota bacterium]
MAPKRKKMTARQRRVFTACIIISAAAMAVMAVSAVIDVVHNGWDALSVVNFAPFCGLPAMIAILVNDRKNDDSSEE